MLICEKYLNVDIYLKLFENIQKYDGIKWYYTRSIYTENNILEYFDVQIKNIDFIKYNDLSYLSNFLNLRKSIKGINQFYNVILDIRIDIFGNYFQNNNIINLNNIINKLDNIDDNIICDKHIDNLIIADCNIYDNLLSKLKNKNKIIDNQCKNEEETKNYIYKLVNDF